MLISSYFQSPVQSQGRWARSFGHLALVFMLAVIPAHAQNSTPILRVETGGHAGQVKAISVDAANHYLVTGSDDKTVRVWDLASRTLVEVLRPPIGPQLEGQIQAVAISPDGNYVACGGLTGDHKTGTALVYVFNRASGQLLRRMDTGGETVIHLVYSRDGHFLAAALGSKGIRLYRTPDYTLVGADIQYEDQSYGADFGPVTEKGWSALAATGIDGYIRLYQVVPTATPPLRLAARLKARDGKLPGYLSFSPDGSRIAYGYGDTAKVSVVSGTDLSPLYTAQTTGTENGNLGAVSWSADGNDLYAAGQFAVNDRNIIRHWPDKGNGAPVDIPVAHNIIQSLVPLRDGGVAYCSFDGTFGTLDGNDHPQIVPSTIQQFRHLLQQFKVSADGSVVTVGTTPDGQPAAFSLSRREILSGPDTASLPALFSPVTSAPGAVLSGWKDSAMLAGAEGGPKFNNHSLALQAPEQSRSAAISPDHKRVAIGGDWLIHVYNPMGTALWQAYLSGVAWDVNITPNNKFLIAALGDGTIRWYHLDTGAEICALYASPDAERWVMWTPSGYYDCSPGGENLVGWHINRGPDNAADFFPVSRFRSTYYRPDVLKLVLTTSTEAQAIHLANLAAAHPIHNTVQQSLPPVVKILTPQSQQAVNSTDLTITYTLRTPSGAPVNEVKALVDGRPAVGERDLQEVSAAGTQRQIKVTIPPRDCEISVIAVNKYAASSPSSVSVVWHGQAPVPVAVTKPRLFVLAAGISAYNDATIALQFPAKDAHDFVNTLEAQKGQMYSDVVVRLLTDAEASKAAILDGFNWITAQTTPKDVAVIFLSGHGANLSGGNYIFVPADFDLKHFEDGGVPAASIEKTVASLKGKTIIFIDSCHAGNVDKVKSTDITGTVNTLASAENGAVVFTAATGSQVALEDPAWKNGAFTKALVEALKGQADFFNTGKITLNAIDTYVSHRVDNLTNGRQSPATAKPETVPDFALATRTVG